MKKKMKAPRKPGLLNDVEGPFYVGVMERDEKEIYIGSHYHDGGAQIHVRKKEAKRLHAWLGKYIAWVEYKEGKKK